MTSVYKQSRIFIRGIVYDLPGCNTLQEIARRLQARFPAAVTNLEPLGPNDPTLAVVLGDHLVELEWYADQGFGVTLVTEDKSFTRGSDAAFADAADAEKYLFQQLAAIADV